MSLKNKKLIIALTPASSGKRAKTHDASRVLSDGSLLTTPTGAVLLELGALWSDLLGLDDVFTAGLRELPMARQTKAALKKIEVFGQLAFFWDELDAAWRKPGTMQDVCTRLNDLCASRDLTKNIYFQIEAGY